jgi:hypothetical protein
MKRLFQFWEIGSNDIAWNSPPPSQAQRLVGVLQVEPADHHRVTALAAISQLANAATRSSSNAIEDVGGSGPTPGNRLTTIKRPAATHISIQPLVAPAPLDGPGQREGS